MGNNSNWILLKQDDNCDIYGKYNTDYMIIKRIFKDAKGLEMVQNTTMITKENYNLFNLLEESIVKMKILREIKENKKE